MQSRFIINIFVLLLLWGCGNSEDDDTVDAPIDMSVSADQAQTGDATTGMTNFPPIEVVDGCDPLQPDVCTFPWPTSFYQKIDETTTTGYRISIGANSLPPSFVSQEPVSPELYSGLDGYGLGSQMYTLIPNVDAGNLPSETNISRSLEASSALMLVEVTADGARQVACWAELDALETDPARRVLFINPAVLLKPNHQYIVMLRNLTTLDGSVAPPSPAFKALRDSETMGTAIANRQAHFDSLFLTLESLDVERSSITAAWDFHTASEDSLQQPVLSLWERAIEELGENGPPLIIDEIESFLAEDDGSGAAFHPHIAYRIRAHVEVPQFLRESEPAFGTVGLVLDRDDTNYVRQNGNVSVPILIGIPRSAVSGTPQTLLNFGHGAGNPTSEGLDLDSSGGCGMRDLVPCRTAHSRMYDTFGFTYFATAMQGMDETAFGTTIQIVAVDVGLFRWVSDPLIQSMVNRMLATRSMARQFGSHPEVINLGITMAETDVRYWGISGGANFGGAFAALSPDVTRAALSAFGMNWVSVLWRSRQFTPLFVTLQTSYPDRWDQIAIISTMQLLWDPTDSVNYMRNLLEAPIDGHPETNVIFDVTEGDRSVPPILAENLARSNVGVKIMENYDDERIVELVGDLQAYPYTGSGIVAWHTGPEWSREGNQPPTADYPDNHGYARQFLSLHRQIATFFNTGEIIDVCEGGTCPTAEELAPFLAE